MTDPQPDIPIKYGSFNNRMLAITIDLTLMFMVILPLVDMIMAHFFKPLDISRLVAVISSPDLRANPPLFISALWQTIREQRALERLTTENLLELAFIALYILPFWFHFSSTPGKMLLRLEIRDAATFKPMTRKQAVIRFFGYIVSALPLSLGFVWAVTNRRSRTFHDLIAGTVVVVAPKSSGE